MLCNNLDVCYLFLYFNIMNNDILFHLPEVLTKVRAGEDPPFRPAVTITPELVTIENVMKQCWDEDPDKRPSLNKISSVLHGFMA